ncbi:hypothetical protein [Haladaptatus halobius]|uniref:hypothetical protein n=1 Tax=Haladaptatus halobius TaxID=2884875 RepID=UPI001D0A4C90|nr:hypothetical protein [Haladaptatus halobius]
MVGPISSEERTAAMSRLKAAIVLLVGSSGGLIALHAGASAVGMAVAVLSGLVVGGLLVWYLDWITR